MAADSGHEAAWRDPVQIAAGWADASAVVAETLRHRIVGDWWGALERTGSTLLVSREYEHLLLGLTVDGERPRLTYMPVPHPSGIAFDERRGVVHVASTRNPNQLLELAPVTGLLPRADRRLAPPPARPLVPVAARFLPGATYVHDLAIIGGRLHANAVGENAVVRIGEKGAERVWWPRAIDRDGGPAIERNYIQLNSIAAGKTVASSYFSASAEAIGTRRPGQLNFPVDRRGVIFSGRTREPVVRGLTRPHSARLRGGQLWVDDSGYGRVGVGVDGAFEPVVELGGWTRGLTFAAGVAFVATSRVIPRFRAYAPGLDVDRARCGVHAIEVDSGQVLGSIFWPAGNQIFALELVPRAFSLGFPLSKGGARPGAIRDLFYAYTTNHQTR